MKYPVLPEIQPLIGSESGENWKIKFVNIITFSVSRHCRSFFALFMFLLLYLDLAQVSWHNFTHRLT